MKTNPARISSKLRYKSKQKTAALQAPSKEQLPPYKKYQTSQEISATRMPKKKLIAKKSSMPESSMLNQDTNSSESSLFLWVNYCN